MRCDATFLSHRHQQLSLASLVRSRAAQFKFAAVESGAPFTPACEQNKTGASTSRKLAKVRILRRFCLLFSVFPHGSQGPAPLPSFLPRWTKNVVLFLLMKPEVDVGGERGMGSIGPLNKLVWVRSLRKMGAAQLGGVGDGFFASFISVELTVTMHALHPIQCWQDGFLFSLLFPPLSKKSHLAYSPV